MSILDLPPGYVLQPDADSPRLIAPNGRTVCVFGPGWTPGAVEEAAKEHAERVDASVRHLETLLRRRANA